MQGFNAAASVTHVFIVDLAIFVVPTKIVYLARGRASRISYHFPGNVTEQDAYLGVPTLLIVALYLRERLRSPAGRFLLAALLVGVVLALGNTATVAGHSIVCLPWKLVSSLPLFDNVLTIRLPVYITLLAAVIVALWAAARAPERLRLALPVLAVLETIPYPARGGFAMSYYVPRFFT